MTIANTDAQLHSIVERIVKLTEDKRAASADIAEIKKEAKSAGYDVKALNLVVKRVMEDEGQRREREEMEAVAASMEAALGEFGSSPLGDAAIKRARAAA